MNNIILITGASSDIGLQLIKSITEECIIIAHYNSSLEPLNTLSKNLTNKIILKIRLNKNHKKRNIDLSDF